jgi:hypothetical protein
VENEGIVIPTQIRWLVNPSVISGRRQNREIAVSLGVFDVKGSRLAQSVVKKIIKAEGVWYQVETYTNEDPDTTCELCCRWGHIQNKCGSRLQCGYCSGHHGTRDHKWNVVRYPAKQGSFCGHTLE